ncbi:hypothetical protein [Actinomadura sp. WMMA1423]|uniref:hypothetical protein n=1 Tax=Actinomadura sp. WMMA1423 TaxID=2591108 RepID=UPI0011470329|nr:hypothetical protein [Actinomadura sp. WMMA1423]
MTERSYPFGSSKINTEDEFSRMMMWAAPDGVCGTPADTALRPVANGSGVVIVPPGEAFVRGQKYLLDEAKQLPIPNNTTGALRRDWIVLRNDPSNDRITAEYKLGGATLPPLTRDWSSVWEVPLGYGAVEAGTSVMQPSAMTDARWFTGWTLAPSVPASRPDPSKGRALIEEGVLLLGDGASWKPATIEGEAPVALATKWPKVESSAVNQVTRSGRHVEITLNVKRATDPYYGTDPLGSPLGTIPALYRPGSTRWFAVHITPNNYARVQVRSDGGIWVDNPTSKVDVDRVLRCTLTYLLEVGR